MGMISTAAVYVVLRWRTRSRLDESLDAFACHGIGGVTGAILTGIFASVNGSSSLITGDLMQFLIQLLGVGITAAYSFGVTFGLAFIINKVLTLRVKEIEEYVGCDVSEHHEIAYS
jgi:Amt family ammonium transporter